MKYDVAISLRWTDVEFARELYDLLRDRLEVFFADDRQEEFAATDGETTFGHVFRDESRIVVILYRKDWGSTTFTRAEEAAIKQRAFSDGYGFTVWVPMDPDKAVPPYLPLQYIWFDIEKYGVAGLASVVEERVRKAGAKVRTESTIDRLKRKKRSIQRESARKAFENSQEGANYFRAEKERLSGLIQKQIDQFVEIDPEIPFQLSEYKGMEKVESWPYRAFFRWNTYAGNSARESTLDFIQQMASGHTFDIRWNDVSTRSFRPTLDNSGNSSWKTSDDEYVSLEAILDRVLGKMAEDVYYAKEQRIKKS